MPAAVLTDNAPASSGSSKNLEKKSSNLSNKSKQLEQTSEFSEPKGKGEISVVTTTDESEDVFSDAISGQSQRNLEISSMPTSPANSRPIPGRGKRNQRQGKKQMQQVPVTLPLTRGQSKSHAKPVTNAPSQPVPVATVAEKIQTLTIDPNQQLSETLANTPKVQDALPPKAELVKTPKAAPAAVQTPRAEAVKYPKPSAETTNSPQADIPSPASEATDAVPPPAPTVGKKNKKNAGPRDSIMEYRPSDMSAEAAVESKERSSLLDIQATRDAGSERPTDAILNEIDEDYRLTDGAKEKLSLSLPPLLKAARGGNTAEFGALLKDSSTDILCKDPVHGQNALHFAVRGGHMGVLELLCHPEIIKTIINAPDNRLNTALHLSVAKSRRITKILLENGASASLQNLRKQTPMEVHILTAKRDDPIMVEMLLRHGAHANAAQGKSTVLHAAVERKLIEIACRLVRHGARLDVKDENGKTVFDKVDRKTLKRLLEKVSQPPTWIPDKDRSSCMLCNKKFGKLGIGMRRHHCRHCGRVCCGECSHLTVESVKFPPAFQGRLKAGSKANHEEKRVCKTCFNVFKERAEKQAEEDEEEGGIGTQVKNFYENVVKYKYTEVKGQANNPKPQ